MPSLQRIKRGHTPGAKDSQTVKGPKTNSNAEVIKNLKAVKRRVAQLMKKQVAADDKSSDIFSKTFSEATPKKASKNVPTPNRSNSALTRQSSAKKASKSRQRKCHLLHALHKLTLGSIDTCVIETRTYLDSDQCAIGSNT